MSKEDKLSMAIANGAPDDAEIAFESHYNHYGNRGYLDLVVEEEYTTTLYEVKSPSAVRNATGANEIIRQATKHANYYFESNPTNSTKAFRLCFYADNTVWEHLTENAGMYREFSRSEINGMHPLVELRHPDSTAIIDVFHPMLGYGTDRWDEQLQLHDEDDPILRVISNE